MSFYMSMSRCKDVTIKVCLRTSCLEKYLEIRAEMAGGHNDLRNIYCSQNIVCVIHSKRMRWKERTNTRRHMTQVRNAYQNTSEKTTR
jgi:hypothetical protein